MRLRAADASSPWPSPARWRCSPRRRPGRRDFVARRSAAARAAQLAQGASTRDAAGSSTTRSASAARRSPRSSSASSTAARRCSASGPTSAPACGSRPAASRAATGASRSTPGSSGARGAPAPTATRPLQGVLTLGSPWGLQLAGGRAGVEPRRRRLRAGLLRRAGDRPASPHRDAPGTRPSAGGPTRTPRAATRSRCRSFLF